MFCTKCGKEVEDDWNICPNCGNILKNENLENIHNEMNQSSISVKKPFYKKGWFWVLAVIIILVGMLVIVRFTGKAENDTKAQNNVKKETETKKKVKSDFSKEDFESLIGKSEKELKEESFEKKVDSEEYQALDGNISIECADGQVASITIKGNAEETPAFHGARIGMDADEAYEKLQSGYSEDIGGDEDGRTFLNLSTKGCVTCKVTNGKVSTIMYMTLSDEDVDAYKKEKEQKEAEAKEKAEEEAEAQAKAEEEAEKANAINSFIGMPGVYICTSPEWDNFTGRIEFGQIQNGAMSFSMGLLELDYQIFKGSAVIIDSNTAQINADGITITITWTNSENMYVTKEGELNNNRDAGTVSAITDNMSYIRASEFN